MEEGTLAHGLCALKILAAALLHLNTGAAARWLQYQAELCVHITLLLCNASPTPTGCLLFPSRLHLYNPPTDCCRLLLLYTKLSSVLPGGRKRP